MLPHPGYWETIKSERKNGGVEEVAARNSIYEVVKHYAPKSFRCSLHVSYLDLKAVELKDVKGDVEKTQVRFLSEALGITVKASNRMNIVKNLHEYATNKELDDFLISLSNTTIPSKNADEPTRLACHVS